MMAVYVARCHNVVMETVVMTHLVVSIIILLLWIRPSCFFVFDGMLTTVMFLYIVKCGHDSCNYYAFDELQLLL